MIKHIKILAFSWLFITPALVIGADRSEVLVKVGDQTVTAGDLEQAVSSSPFATQFNTVDENEQAGLRGDILKGIVATKLLYLEAKNNGIDKSETFLKEVSDFKVTAYYRAYMEHLRSRITIPPEEEARIKEAFKGNADAMAAARSNYIGEAYQQLRDYTILALRDKYKIKIFKDRLTSLKKAKADTVFLEGDGVRITYGDVTNDEQRKEGVSQDWLLNRLFQRAELLIVSKAGEEEGLDIDAKIKEFSDERLPALLVETKEKEWVPDERAMETYFNDHPDISKTPTRWHVGQIVLKDRKMAKAMRESIKRGASLFFLAGYYSSDPYGRSKNGDMGWVTEGKGYPEIEKALKKMGDAQISDIIKTPLGYHIVTVLERRPGEKRSFAGMKDKVKQAMTHERLTKYLAELEEKYKVDWKVIKPVIVESAGNEG